jgi:hypothetical protein
VCAVGFENMIHSYSCKRSYTSFHDKHCVHIRCCILVVYHRLCPLLYRMYIALHSLKYFFFRRLCCVTSYIVYAFYVLQIYLQYKRILSDEVFDMEMFVIFIESIYISHIPCFLSAVHPSGSSIHQPSPKCDTRDRPSGRRCLLARTACC